MTPVTPQRHQKTKVDIIMQNIYIRTRQGFKKVFRVGKSKQPTLLGHFIISGSVLVLIGFGYLGFSSYADKQAKDWLEVEELTTIGDKLAASPDEKIRLNEQLNQIDARIERHSEIMVFFYKHYYISISLTSASALVAGICLFFISKRGFEAANNALVNIFIVTSSAVIYFGDLPGIFRQNENITANQELYLAHINLRNEVHSYLATGGTVGEDSTKLNEFSRVEPNRFIHSIDQKLAELNKIALGFDATGITDYKERALNLDIPEKPSPTPN